MTSIQGNTSQPGSCPLCGSFSDEVISETRYSHIWKNLFIEWGATFSEEARAAYTPADDVRLYNCQGCGLHYFWPAIPGGADFYSQLSSSGKYYNDTKWEFDYAKQWLRRDSAVLDIACGEGAFLRSIRNVVKRPIGIDRNADAIRKGRDAGLELFDQDLNEFSQGHRQQFDFVSAFQVIEHLAAIMPFVSAAYSCVKPGGLLILSVPNRERRCDAAFGSLDYPPHHISRWSEHQLTLIANALGAQLVTLTKQPLTTSQTIVALRCKELPALLRFNFVGRGFAIKVISRIALSFPFRLVWKTMNLSERLAMFGMSIVAVIKKPISASDERVI